jgi:hypothetical protein
MSEKKKIMEFVTSWLRSCDFCRYQHDPHYCSLFSCAVENMDIRACQYWEEKKKS